MESSRYLIYMGLHWIAMRAFDIDCLQSLQDPLKYDEFLHHSKPIFFSCSVLPSFKTIHLLNHFDNFWLQEQVLLFEEFMRFFEIKLRVVVFQVCGR